MDAKTKMELLNAISEAEIAEYREIFSLVDRDGGGSISKRELQDLLETLGVNASAAEVDLMVNEIDADGNDEIDFEEFMLVMSRKVNSAHTPADLKAAFRVFQSSDSPAGKIHIDQVVYALSTFGTAPVEKDVAKELAAQLEPDMDGWVDFEGFVDMMVG